MFGQPHEAMKHIAIVEVCSGNLARWIGSPGNGALAGACARPRRE